MAALLLCASQSSASVDYGDAVAASFGDGSAADDLWFGLATAPAHAENQLNDTWLEFASRGGVHAWRNTPRAAERLHFWTDPEVDIKLAADTGVSVYRLGVDWGRLVPDCSLDRETPCGVQQWEVLDRYIEIIKSVRSHGMRVMLSLFHHSFPRWGVTWGRAETPRGAAAGEMFTHPRSVEHFVAFARDVIERFAPLVDFWVTFNEPVVFSMLTHCMGIWPPGPAVTNPYARLNCMTNPKTGALLAQNNMIRAHRQIYALIRANELAAQLPLAPVGVAHLIMDSRPFAVGFDSASTLFIDLYSKYYFIDQLKETLDFCGINYYGLEIVTGIGPGLAPKEVEYSGSGRGISPTGLVSLLEAYQARYGTDPKARFMRGDGYGFVVTENGIADSQDLLRPAYLLEHLLALRAAQRRGIRVRGYTFWTASDNWEWADGYCPKFGLAAVNRSDPLLRRVPRDSYHLFTKVVRSRRVTVAQRHAAWRRVTTAAANGEMKEVCRSGDALGSLDTPDRWPVLGGTTLPDGRVVDWRYDDAKVESPGAEDTAIVTDFIEHSMALSSATGFDPAAAVVSALAGFGHEFVGRPPPPPTLPGGGGGQDTAAVLASVLDALDAMQRRPLPPPPPPGKGGADMFGHFFKGFADALDGDATATEPVEPGAARSFWPFEKAGSARAGSSLWLTVERRPEASGDGRRGGPAPLAAAAALACLALMVAVRRRRRSSEGASSEGALL